MPSSAPSSAIGALPAARTRVLDAMRRYFDDRQFSDVLRCSQELGRASERLRGPAGLKVLVAFGGGKDSAFALAIIRMLQLLHFEKNRDVFHLRVATNRHPGMPRAVLMNIDRAYKSLEMYADPACELLMVDGDDIRPFDVTQSISHHSRETARISVLLTGHQTQGNGRPTFCNQCNLDLARFFSLLLSSPGASQLLVTGDSSSELRAYYAWMSHAAKRVGIPRTEGAKSLPEMLTTLNVLHHKYADELGTPSPPSVADTSVLQSPEFFRLFSFITYRAEDHWALLTEFLGFTFDDVAFSFTETDCGNPSLMAHIHGLKYERLLGRSYTEGINQYAEYGIALMERKQFPEHLIQAMKDRYTSAGAIEATREQMAAYAFDAFGITNEQLICMVFSPFTASARHLERYLSSEQRTLLEHIEPIKRILRGDAGESVSGPSWLSSRLVEISGLDLYRLQYLFSIQVDPAVAISQGGQTVLSALFDGDPHKRRVVMPSADSGENEQQWLSGR